MVTDTCRIIVDPEPQSGVHNMAIDAALLQAADEQPTAPVLRVYRWSEPTVSVGYFQTAGPAAVDAALRGCPQVRRLTGGGAILHHHELTYSCVIPRIHPVKDEPLQLYHLMHQAISRALQACGASTGFRADLPVPEQNGADKAEAFLCFLRSDPRDLAACGQSARHHPKVTGSAQRRRRGTILQHGSILLRASPLLPRTPGICDLFPEFNMSEFGNILPGHLAAAISAAQIESDYTEREQEIAFQTFGEEGIPTELSTAGAGETAAVGSIVLR